MLDSRFTIARLGSIYNDQRYTCVVIRIVYVSDGVCPHGTCGAELAPRLHAVLLIEIGI